MAHAHPAFTADTRRQNKYRPSPDTEIEFRRYFPGFTLLCKQLSSRHGGDARPHDERIPGATILFYLHLTGTTLTFATPHAYRHTGFLSHLREHHTWHCLGHYTTGHKGNVQCGLCFLSSSTSWTIRRWSPRWPSRTERSTSPHTRQRAYWLPLTTNDCQWTMQLTTTVV